MRRRRNDIVVDPPTKPRGVILALHGFTQTPNKLRHESGLDAVGAATHSIVHYVSAGSFGFWHWMPRGPTSNADVRMLLDLTRHYAEERGLPVSMIGRSAGGCMTARMIAEYPTLYQSAGIYAGWLHDRIKPRDGAGLPVLVLRGASDRLVKPQQTKKTVERFYAAGYDVYFEHKAPGGHPWRFENNKHFIQVIEAGRRPRRVA